MSKTDGITFPRLECWNPLAERALIAAQVNGKRVLCAIAGQTLQTHFGVGPLEPMPLVRANRPAIEAAAERLIREGRFEQDGSVLIRASDL